MTISSGSVILASDYNTIQSTIANVLGTGSGSFGYGQTVTSQQATAGTVISDQPAPAHQWNALYNDMVKIASHQGTNISGLVTAVTNNVSSGKVIQASDIGFFSTTATTLSTNALNYSNSDMATTSQLTSTRVNTPWGYNTQSTLLHSFTVSFPDINSYRYFFNTGGAILFTASRTGGSTTAQNNDWATTLTNIGTVVFNYNSTSADSGTGSSIGAYSIVSSPQTIYTKNGGAVNSIYSPNSYSITASLTGSVITFSITFNDAFSDNNIDDVDGTLTSTISMREAGASVLTINAPTFTNGTLLSASAPSQITVSYPSTAIDGTPFTYIVSNGVPNEAYYITTDAANHARIPSSGTLNLNGAGQTTVTSNDFYPDIGTINVTFHFAQSGDINKTIVVSPAPVTVSYPSSATDGSPFTYTISSGLPNETYYITTDAPNHLQSGTLSLDGSGAATVSGNDFSPDYGTFTVTFHFAHHDPVTKTIVVSAAPLFQAAVSYPQSATDGSPFTYTISSAAPNDTYYITTDAPNHTRIPSSGTLSLDGNGAATVTTNDFSPDSGTIHVAFHFTNSGTVNKIITVYPTPLAVVSYPSTATDGTPFIYSISRGIANDTYYITTDSPNHARIPSSGTLSLDGNGAAYVSGNDFSPDSGTIHVTFHFTQSGTVIETIVVSPAPVAPTYQAAVSYPSTVTNGSPFTYNINSGYPNETYYITTDAPNHTRIPSSGTLSLDGAGAATVSGNDFSPDVGTFTVTFHFSQSNPVTKTVTVLHIPISITYPLSATDGTPFSYSISNGYANENFYIATTAPSHPRYPATDGTFFTLDGSGNYSRSDGDFSPDSGTFTVTFHFSQSGSVTKTIVVSPQPALSVDYLIVGGGAGGSTGTFYYGQQFNPIGTDGNSVPEIIYENIYNGSLGFGGGGGRVIYGSTTLSPTSTQSLTVGSGGLGGYIDQYTSYVGTDGSASSFLGQTATGGVGSFGDGTNQGIGATYSSFAAGGTSFGGGNAASWSRFMEGCSTYGGNGSTWTVDKTVYFPQSANYDIIGCADDFGFVSIDGAEYDLAGFTSWNVQTVSATQGNHTVRSYVSNFGGYQTGIAFTITCQGQHYDITGTDIVYGTDGRDGINGANGASGANGTGAGGNGSSGFYYTSVPSGNGGSGCVAIRYPGSSAKFNGGTILISGGYVHHVFTTPGDYSLTPI
jgi:hypothetical protein